MFLLYDEAHANTNAHVNDNLYAQAGANIIMKCKCNCK